MLAEEIIDEAIKGSEKYDRGERDTLLSISSDSDWQPQDGYDVIRNNEYIKAFHPLSFAWSS